MRIEPTTTYNLYFSINFVGTRYNFAIYNQNDKVKEICENDDNITTLLKFYDILTFEFYYRNPVLVISNKHDDPDIEPIRIDLKCYDSDIVTTFNNIIKLLTAEICKKYNLNMNLKTISMESASDKNDIKYILQLLEIAK